MAQIILKNLNDTKDLLKKILESNKLSSENWSIYTIMCHCAQTIQYSMEGYPQNKPKWIQNTVGKLVIRKFLKQGYMSHNLQAHVPGAPAFASTGTAQEGVRVLLDTIEKFENYSGELKPHLIFGKLSKESYDQYFSMHIADHLSEVTF